MKKRILRGATVIVLTTFLWGCDQINERLTVLTGKKPEDALSIVTQKVSMGQFTEALQEAERYLNQEGPLQPKFAFAAAKAYAQLGNVDAALANLTIAIRGLGLSTDDVMFDPAFRSLQTNVRFLALLTDTTNASTEIHSITVRTDSGMATQSSKPTAAPQPKPERGIVVDSGAGTSIQMNRHGTEVRAGDITIKLPN